MPTLISAVSVSVDEGPAQSAVVKLSLFQRAVGVYEFVPRGTRAAGSLVSDGDGGYAITLGDDSGNGTVAQLSTGDALIF